MSTNVAAVNCTAENAFIRQLYHFANFVGSIICPFGCCSIGILRAATVVEPRIYSRNELDRADATLGVDVPQNSTN